MSFNNEVEASDDRRRRIAAARCPECNRGEVRFLAAARHDAPTDQLACLSCGGMFPLGDFAIPDEPGDDWYATHELCESFYGLIGGGTTALFDNFPGLFEQICGIAQVDFSDVLPLYVPSSVLDGQEFDDEVAARKKALPLVQARFRALHDNLVARPGWDADLVFPSSGYNPDREYFEDFANDRFHLSKDEFEEWEVERFHDEENIRTSFGRDVRYVLHFIELAIKMGSQNLWFVGR